MNNFPLIRRKRTNEYMMTGVFAVTVLYLLPRWISNPFLFLEFSAMLALGLVIDVTANFIRYRRPVCAVSAAVTSAILEVLIPGVPLMGRLLAVSLAFIMGKHLWGGTGKNIFNPAIVGFVVISLFYKIDIQPLNSGLLLLPGLVLSLAFISSRPFASTGFMLGMILALLLRQELSPNSFISAGIIFWGCIVITDPVTISPTPWLGSSLGLIFGFLPLVLTGSVIYMSLGILFINGVSYIFESVQVRTKPGKRFRLRRIVPFLYKEIQFIDLTEHEKSLSYDISCLSAKEILYGIKECAVFGLGGGAFPTYEKIMTVLNSKASEKHLIINGVECDPGLLHDKWIIRNYPKEILKGIELVNKCVGFESSTLAVKDIIGLDLPDNIKVHQVSDYYPAGAEKLLIKEILKRDIGFNSIPAEEGILVLNLQTIYSLYESLAANKKVNTRFITAANLKDNTSAVLRVNLESKVMDIVKKLYPNSTFAFCGGGLMQCHLADEDEVIGKNNTFIGIADFPHYKESQLCSKCGFCTTNCPAGLAVNKIYDLINRGKMDELDKYSPDRCIKCGICSYGCPAGRNIKMPSRNKDSSA